MCHKTNWVAATAISNRWGDRAGWHVHHIYIDICISIYIYKGMWHGVGGTDWMHAFMPKAFAGHWHHRMRKQERSPGTRPTGCDSPWILEEWVGGRSSGQWAKPEAKTNRTHFWLHWGSCVDLWLKELTDKIKYALCPAVAAGDRRVFGSGFEGGVAGAKVEKGSGKGEWRGTSTGVTSTNNFWFEKCSEFIV